MTYVPTEWEGRGRLMPSVAQWFREADTGEWYLVPIGPDGRPVAPPVMAASTGDQHPATVALSAPLSAPLSASPVRRRRFLAARAPGPSPRAAIVSLVLVPAVATGAFLVGGLGVGSGLIRDLGPYLLALLVPVMILRGFAWAIHHEDDDDRRRDREPLAPVRPIRRTDFGPPPPARPPQRPARPTDPTLPPAARPLPSGRAALPGGWAALPPGHHDK
jgi:hypothetical protein